MSSPRTSPAGLAMLTPQLLAEAAADPGRTWAAQARCTATDPDLFFRPRTRSPGRRSRSATECPVRLIASPTRSSPTSRSESRGARDRGSGILCGDIGSGAADCPRPATAPGLLRDAGTAAAAGADRCERPLVTADGPRGPGRRGPGPQTPLSLLARTQRARNAHWLASPSAASASSSRTRATSRAWAGVSPADNSVITPPGASASSTWAGPGSAPNGHVQACTNALTMMSPWTPHCSTGTSARPIGQHW